MGRWTPPARPTHGDRFTAGGLGAGPSGNIVSDGAGGDPQEDVAPEYDGGFSGIRSRSRFASPVVPPAQGHGSAQARPAMPAPNPDPAVGDSQFDPERPWSLSDAVRRWLRGGATGLGTDDIQLSRAGIIHYERSPMTVAVAPTQPMAPFDPKASGPLPTARITRAWTLRREFQQDAQSFLGMHQLFRHRSPGSRSPVRMLPPRDNRLTVRTLPASFGATTEVLT